MPVRSGSRKFCVTKGRSRCRPRTARAWVRPLRGVSLPYGGKHAPPRYRPWTFRCDRSAFSPAFGSWSRSARACSASPCASMRRRQQRRARLAERLRAALMAPAGAARVMRRASAARPSCWFASGACAVPSSFARDERSPNRCPASLGRAPARRNGCAPCTGASARRPAAIPAAVRPRPWACRSVAPPCCAASAPAPPPRFFRRGGSGRTAGQGAGATATARSRATSNAGASSTCCRTAAPTGRRRGWRPIPACP